MSIKKASNNNIEPNIKFSSKWESINKKESYDLVFAMSVLCRWPQTQNIKNCKNVYPFTEFNAQIYKIDELIKKKGILVIYNANFRFSDTEISKKYESVTIPQYLDSGFVTKFDKNNNCLVDQKYEYTMFQKK